MSAQWQRRPPWLAVLSGLACAAGLWLVAAGLAVPLEANVAQRRLEGEFDRALAARPALRGGERAALAPVADALVSTSRSPLPHARPGLAHDGIVARLIVQRLGVRQIVRTGNGTHEQLAEGPVVLRGDDAASRVTVLAAHRDTHFLFVRDLRANDEILVQLATGATRRYRVVRFQTVLWNRFSIPLDPARPLLALSTCYPFGGTEYGGPWRRIVWAEQVG